MLSNGAILVRYEDLTSSSIDETQKLFDAIGLADRKGVDHYDPPKNYKWSWMNDDGGEKIKSLKVTPGNKERTDHDLINMISSHSRALHILRQYRYNEFHPFSKEEPRPK